MAKKKKKKTPDSKLSPREKRMNRMNPWVVLFGYFTIFAILAYPLLYLAFRFFFKVPFTSWTLFQSSVALGIAGAAYYGVILKAKREGRKPRY